MAEFDLPYKPVTTAEFEVILIKYNAKAFQFFLITLCNCLQFFLKNTPMFGFRVILTYFT